MKRDDSLLQSFLSVHKEYVCGTDSSGENSSTLLLQYIWSVQLEIHGKYLVFFVSARISLQIVIQVYKRTMNKMVAKQLIIFRIWVGSRRRKRRSEISFRPSDKRTNYLIRNSFHIFSHSINVIADTTLCKFTHFYSFLKDVTIRSQIYTCAHRNGWFSDKLFLRIVVSKVRDKQRSVIVTPPMRIINIPTFQSRLFSSSFLLSFHLFSTMSDGRSGGSLMGGTDEPSVSKVVYLYRSHLIVFPILGGSLLHGGS